MSEFAGLDMALSSLRASQRGLELAAQNVSNANTDGYSRQRLDLENIGGPTVPALWSVWTGSGGGVRIADITRFRDQFMEIQAALEHGANASLGVGSTTMQNIEQLFNEPSDAGIQSQLSQFWAGFDDVANSPADGAARVQLLQRASTLAASFNTASQRLTQLRSNTVSQLGATVAQINSYADQVAQLNKAIKAGTVSGLNVNDLMDQRDLIANKLAEASGGTIRSTDFDQVNVQLNGFALVQEDQSRHVQVDATGANVVLRWTADNTAAIVTSGTAGGQINAVNTTIPGYIANLDTVATQLRDQVNTLHSAITGSIATADQDQSAAGNVKFDVSLDGGAFTSVTVAGANWSGAGGAAALQAALQASLNAALGAGAATATVTGGAGNPLAVTVVGAGVHTLQVKATTGNTGFGKLLGTTAVGADGIGGRRFFSGTTAAMLALSNDVAGNANAVAAGTAANGPLDGSVALNLADLADEQVGSDATYRQMIVQVGVDTQTAQTRSDIQQKSMASLDNSRSSYSGVNTDEEMTSMVQFQHTYEAAARLMTAMDSILDTLINHTGLTT